MRAAARVIELGRDKRVTLYQLEPGGAWTVPPFPNNETDVYAGLRGVSFRFRRVRGRSTRHGCFGGDRSRWFWQARAGVGWWPPKGFETLRDSVQHAWQALGIDRSKQCD